MLNGVGQAELNIYSRITTHAAAIGKEDEENCIFEYCSPSGRGVVGVGDAYPLRGDQRWDTVYSGTQKRKKQVNKCNL